MPNSRRWSQNSEFATAFHEYLEPGARCQGQKAACQVANQVNLDRLQREPPSSTTDQVGCSALNYTHLSAGPPDRPLIASSTVSVHGDSSQVDMSSRSLH